MHNPYCTEMAFSDLLKRIKNPFMDDMIQYSWRWWWIQWTTEWRMVLFWKNWGDLDIKYNKYLFCVLYSLYFIRSEYAVNLCLDMQSKFILPNCCSHLWINSKPLFHAYISSFDLNSKSYIIFRIICMFYWFGSLTPYYSYYFICVTLGAPKSVINNIIHSFFRGALRMMENALGLSECQHIQPRFSFWKLVTSNIPKKDFIKAYWQWYEWISKPSAESSGIQMKLFALKPQCVWKYVPGDFACGNSRPFWFHSSGWNWVLSRGCPKAVEYHSEIWAGMRQEIGEGRRKESFEGSPSWSPRSVSPCVTWKHRWTQSHGITPQHTWTPFSRKQKSGKSQSMGRRHFRAVGKPPHQTDSQNSSEHNIERVCG